MKFQKEKIKQQLEIVLSGKRTLKEFYEVQKNKGSR